MTAKKRCTIFANCQRNLIQSHLLISPEFVETYTFERIPHNYEAIDQKLTISNEVLATTDLFIYQPLGSKYGELSSDRLLTRLRPDCTTLAVPYFYFKGYYPQDTNNPLAKPEPRYPFGRFPYGDRNIIDRVEAGMSHSEIIKDLSRPDFYSREFLLETVESTLTELSKRERETEIKISDFIRKHYRDRVLFETVNHPVSLIGFEVANQILEQLQLAPILKTHYQRYVSPFANSQAIAIKVVNRVRMTFNQPTVANPYAALAGSYQVPVYPSVIMGLELSCLSLNSRYKVAFTKRKVTFQEYLAAYLNQYQ